MLASLDLVADLHRLEVLGHLAALRESRVRVLEVDLGDKTTFVEYQINSSTLTIQFSTTMTTTATLATTMTTPTTTTTDAPSAHVRIMCNVRI